MDEDGTYPNIVQESDVLHHLSLQAVVDHGVAAILHDYGLAVELLEIWQGFDQHSGVYRSV
jgi:hypothetical protein